MARNKTDANDADGIAHLAEVGFYQAIRVKGFESMLTRTLVGARRQLTRVSVESNLRRWGLGLRERIGFKRAAVAVARKPALTKHAMLKSGAAFDPGTGPAT